jgi:maleamate amidohydrolase
MDVRRKALSIVIRGTAGAELGHGLEPRSGEHTLVKTRYSAFFRTGLDSLLSVLRPTALILAGVNTHACIRTTAIDAYQRDLVVLIAGDCVGSWDLEHHDVSLRYLDGRIGRVMTAAEIAAEF